MTFSEVRKVKLLKKILLATAFLSSSVSLNTWADTAMSWNLARDMYLMTEAAPAGSPWSFMQNKSGVNVSANYTLFPTFQGGHAMASQPPAGGTMLREPGFPFPTQISPSRVQVPVSYSSGAT